MKLILTDEELDDLLKRRALIPNNGGYALKIPDENSKSSVYIEVSTDVNLSITEYNTSLPVALEPHKVIVKSDVESLYHELRKEFPVDTHKSIWNRSGGVNLRTGKKISILKSCKELLQDFTREQIIQAAKYEVQSRINYSSKTNKDELQYMKRLGTWVNDATNIEAMLERMQDDVMIAAPTRVNKPSIL